MNFQRILFIAALEEQNEKRNRIRIIRRNLRDTLNPFEIPDNNFKQMFRLDKTNVERLINELHPYVPQRGTIPLHLKILATLHFAGTGSFQNPVGSNAWIALSQTSISRVIYEITSIISQQLFRNWVKFPTSVDDKNAVKAGFYERWGARGIIGVIDGTHVEILAPPIADQNHPPFVYINRKGRHSINVMLISDANTKIIGCNARFPGSVHDAAIWQMSNIRNHLHREYQNGDKQSHLIGDSGYPLEAWLYTPFATIQENTQAEFNKQLTTVRNVIERTNGVLKGRFRCLSRHRVLLYHPVRAAHIIHACCVFHNMAVEAGIPIPDDQIEYREDDADIADDQERNNSVLQQGRTARDNYIRHNFM